MKKPPSGGAVAVLCVLFSIPSPAAPADSGWESWIAGPQTRLNAPVAVPYAHNNNGSVTGASNALEEDGQAATLTRTGASSPLLALDFGLPLSGKIEVVFGDTVTAPVSFAFSQRLEFLAIGSDTDAFHLGDITATPRPGITWRTDLRRGFRYLLIYLPQNGTVAIDAVRVYHTPMLGTPDTYDGRFLCSDDLLNRIWYGCVYTQEICTTSGLDADGPWEKEDGWLSVAYEDGSDFGFSVPGSGWDDGELRFRFRIMPLGRVCAWSFRAQDHRNNYMWQIISAEGGAPNTLRKHILQNGSYVSIADVPLPSPVREGEIHEIRMNLNGSAFETRLDDALIDTTVDSRFPRGRIGFRADPSGEHFHVDDVRVSRGDSILFEDDFSGDFQALDPAKWDRAEILTINDGAKRDRVWVWGDFYPAQRTAWVAHWIPGIIAESLRDGAEHQYTAAHEAQYGAVLEGKIPAANAGNYMASDGWSIRWLDDYTLWWVATLHHYWMRTGDDAFLAEMYPSLQRVFGWLLRKHNAQGLSTVQQGDWYWSFLRTGAVTSFNALYVHCLRSGAEMAAALGFTSDWLAWRARADGVEAAINLHLFDSGKQLYVDRPSDRTHFPLDANALSIVYGVADPPRALAILDRIEALMWSPIGTRTATPGYGTWGHHDHVWAWYVQFEVEARFLLNDDLRAFEAIRRPWGLMVDGDPGRTMWEFIMPHGGVENGLRNTDHAFSSGAAWLLSEFAAGIQPTSPGFATFHQTPHPGELEWVECRVPTPHGPIAVDYRLDAAGGVYDCTLANPPGTTGRIGVPRLGATARVVIDGEVRWTPSGPGPGASSDAAYLYFPGIPPGTHTIEARFDAAIPDADAGWILVD